MAIYLLPSLVLRGVVRTDVLASLCLGNGKASGRPSGFDPFNRHPVSADAATANPCGRPEQGDRPSPGVTPGAGRSRRFSGSASCLGRRLTSVSATRWMRPVAGVRGCVC